MEKPAELLKTRWQNDFRKFFEAWEVRTERYVVSDVHTDFINEFLFLKPIFILNSYTS
jgi:hypothetical protein